MKRHFCRDAINTYKRFHYHFYAFFFAGTSAAHSFRSALMASPAIIFGLPLPACRRSSCRQAFHTPGSHEIAFEAMPHAASIPEINMLLLSPNFTPQRAVSHRVYTPLARDEQNYRRLYPIGIQAKILCRHLLVAMPSPLAPRAHRSTKRAATTAAH